jgi:uncharacterized protein (TIGR00730 family)
MPESICVFCGSSAGFRGAYAEAAASLGREIARRGLGLVYGGGRVGLMGVLAEAVLEAGSTVVGVIPEALMGREVDHEGLTRLEVVSSIHERKARMAELSEAFIALPGGLGTLEELFEAWTWGQLGFHHKPCGLLEVDGYFDSLLAFLDRTVEEGFVRKDHRSMLLVDSEPESLLDRLQVWEPPVGEKWLDRD